MITGSTAEEKAKFVAEAKSDAAKIADLFEIQKGKGNSPEWSLNYALGIVRYGYDDLHATIFAKKIKEKVPWRKARYYTDAKMYYHKTDAEATEYAEKRH